MYLSYFGIRTENLERSLKFYVEIFGLGEISRGDNSGVGGGKYILLKDKKSGQKLELNWYPSESSFGTHFSAGEGLDHISFKVDDVNKTLIELASKGIMPIDLPPSLADYYNGDNELFKVSYVKDPDGNWIEIYQNETPATSEVSEAY